MAKGLKEKFAFLALLGTVAFAGSLFLIALVFVLLSALGIVIF